MMPRAFAPVRAAAGRVRAAVVRSIPIAAASLFLIPTASAQDAYRLWLQYRDAKPQSASSNPARVTASGQSETARIARTELETAMAALGATVPVTLATRDQGSTVAGLSLTRAGDEGYVIRRRGEGIVIAANRDIGLLYGAFDLIRRMQTGASLDQLDVVSAPKVDLRLLNHWDNLDRTVERGYSGQSIWDWWKLGEYADPRYTDYARANASIGINGTVINNVNTNALSLTPAYIAKAAKLADILRPWGIKVYLSARWSAPVELDKLKTADPLDPAVAAWWKAKADEIYAAIPDFGGFLVKANSEGQPGPQDYKRSHADGANMLAAALKPHGGVVMWRAFVYQQENPDDRHKQAYDDFKPLDGTFADNVIVQVKNGAIDFQPREPFHPMFGAMPSTPLMMEFQITKEYLGFETHLAYLAPMWEEALDADTMAKGKGSTVARVVDGSLEGHALTGMAGVANIGSDMNWSGSVFDQANWYAYGRLAWDHGLSSEQIAREWAAMTFTRDPTFVAPTVAMMMRSREAVVDYMTPLGLGHLMATGHHYGPAPWVSELERPEWNPVYYHRADKGGIGFDRTRSGSDAVSQYAPPVARMFGNRKTVPEEFLLWFHRVSWEERMPSGRSLWEELVARYDRGVSEVVAMQAEWAKLEALVDPIRYKEVTDFLAIQHKEATWWRDACLAYFSDISGRALPPGVRPPAHSLEHYKAIQFPFAPGHH